MHCSIGIQTQHCLWSPPKCPKCKPCRSYELHVLRLSEDNAEWVGLRSPPNGCVIKPKWQRKQLWRGSYRAVESAAFDCADDAYITAATAAAAAAAAPPGESIDNKTASRAALWIFRSVDKPQSCVVNTRQRARQRSKGFVTKDPPSVAPSTTQWQTKQFVSTEQLNQLVTSTSKQTCSLRT